MAQELNSISKVAIVGAGPAGCMCAYFLQDYADVIIFDYASPLRTLLPTGGGRCNLAYAEYDFKSLAENYPRGEKFLYSVLSRFSTKDTIDFFEDIGIKTYVQDDLRIFPVSNSASDVRNKILSSLRRVRFKKELIETLDFDKFDYVVVSTGGHSSYKFLKDIGHNIVSPVPSLTGLITEERFPPGVCVKGVKCLGLSGDILFTHEGISGPLIYKISSINARCEFPYYINLDFCGGLNLQKMLNKNSHKSVKNLLSEIVPKSFAEHILKKLVIELDLKSHQINGEKRDKILSLLTNYRIRVEGVSRGGEVVTCGGVDLKEINSKTMESKIVPNLYFCGEVIDVDGFCGGFNLQNCWSTAYVAANSILKKLGI